MPKTLPGSVSPPHQSLARRLQPGRWQPPESAASFPAREAQRICAADTACRLHGTVRACGLVNARKFYQDGFQRD